MRKKVMAVVVAVLAFSLIAASAATLGGINVASGVGAEADIVAACDVTADPDATPATTDNVSVYFDTSWNGSSFVVDWVRVEGIDDACVGSQINVVLDDGSTYLELGELTVASNGTGNNDNFRTWNGGFSFSATALSGVTISIAG